MTTNVVMLFGLLLASTLLVGCSTPQSDTTSESGTVTGNNLAQEVTDQQEVAANNDNDFQKIKNTTLGIKFQYPKDRMIRQDSESNRIFIENMENKDYMIGDFPDDFLSMWIGYRTASSDTSTYEDEIQQFNQTSAKKSQPNTSFPTLFTYEFPYNPASERSGVGPFLEAIWEHNSYIFYAQTMDSENRENNELQIKILQTILSSLEPTE